MFDPDRIRAHAFARHPALAALRDYVENHPTEALSLPRAAAVAGLDAKYLSSLFHARVGVRFKQWETYMRAAHARRLIARSNFPLETIAREFGFSDLRSFQRAFVRTFGTTPRKVRDAAARRPAAAAR